jgi:hypothetical protein
MIIIEIFERGCQSRDRPPESMVIITINTS